MLYFDNAATSYPKPQRVIRAVANAFEHQGANPGRSGHTMAMDTALGIYSVREAAASLFHMEEPENVVFCHNATHAINLALKGVLRQGDHVIISDLDHNALLRPVHALAEMGKITYSIARVDPLDDTRTVQSFARLIRPDTKLIACSHGSNVFGFRLPIAELGRLAAREDLLFLVDAAQTAGVVDINMGEMGIDFLCASGHKSLYGPTGTGLLLTPLGPALNTIIEGGTGSFSADYGQPAIMPDRLESGTINTIGVMGLGAGIGYVAGKGIDNIYDHEMRIGAEIHSRLKQIKGIQLYTDSFQKGVHLPVISFNLAGIHSEEVGQLLSEQGIAVRAGLHCAPLAHEKMGTLSTGTVRISIGAFNTSQQAFRLCDVIKKIAAKHCITPGIC